MSKQNDKTSWRYLICRGSTSDKKQKQIFINLFKLVFNGIHGKDETHAYENKTVAKNDGGGKSPDNIKEKPTG